MGTPREFPVRFKPRSVSDTVDGDNSTIGAYTSLQNLIWDPSTPNCLICRPANALITDFTGLPGSPGTAGVTVVAFPVGNIVYGLVGITAGTYAGKDYPFAYDTVGETFLTVSSITTANVPTSQATTGAWTPPQMDLMGVKLVTAHIGFDGTTHFFGSFDLTNPIAPVWSAGNTATNGLPSVPQALQQFNNRIYFFCKNVAYYTDTLALTMTNSNQSFTLGDFTPITAAGGLPVGTTSQGILQGILAFKTNKIWLITGDVAQTDLAVNELSPSVGTSAPRSVVPTPEGVRFVAIDGIRNINFFGVVSLPDPDLAVPFIYAVTPSRVAAGYNSDIYRICTQNGNAVNSPFQDFWYDFKRKGWTGPHTFQYDLAIPLSNDFMLASNILPAKLWDAFVVQGHQGGGTSFIENGVVLNWQYETCPMTDLENIYANSCNRSTIEIASPASGQIYNFIAQDENGSLLSQGSIAISANQTIWGAFIWGAANWGASQSGLLPRTIPWNSAVVFNKLSIMGSGPSSLGFKIASLHLGYKRLNYLLN